MKKIFAVMSLVLMSVFFCACTKFPDWEKPQIPIEEEGNIEEQHNPDSEQPGPEIEDPNVTQPEPDTEEPPTAEQPEPDTEDPATEQPDSDIDEPADEQPQSEEDTATHKKKKDHKKQRDTESPGQTPAPESPEQAPDPEPPKQTPDPQSPENSQDDFVSEVVRLVNVERSKNGLAPLTMDSSLNSAAQIRANELNSLFSHTRPNGSSCVTVLDELKISYRSWGENIAIGYGTPSEVVKTWMDSSGHRANILGDYSKIGIGVVKATSGGYSGYAWTQLFTK